MTLILFTSPNVIPFLSAIDWIINIVNINPNNAWPDPPILNIPTLKPRASPKPNKEYIEKYKITFSIFDIIPNFWKLKAFEIETPKNENPLNPLTKIKNIASNNPKTIAKKDVFKHLSFEFIELPWKKFFIFSKKM
ncbi:hypothetical protein STURON_00400 [Spiroplasma turonicum]|uniref:Uncharacterized protein n=1 Tax=Spiroplasma turonicum TaxID=216946 RepID=A0A0K1P5N8_9MOLU|nr:hypothetical protein STURON_00400 [Spiroplasma turonicum]